MGLSVEFNQNNCFVNRGIVNRILDFFSPSDRDSVTVAYDSGVLSELLEVAKGGVMGSSILRFVRFVRS